MIALPRSAAGGLSEGATKPASEREGHTRPARTSRTFLLQKQQSSVFPVPIRGGSFS
jgi:hypothetical protein